MSMIASTPASTARARPSIIAIRPSASVFLISTVLPLRLAGPLAIAFAFGLVGIAVFSLVVGKLLGYSIPMSIAIGLTALYGFPGTMILSQEAAKGRARARRRWLRSRARSCPR